MEPEAKNLLVICGPTSVGKSTTAIKLAKNFDGEIINCDSMQIYKDFDIGTDKPPVDKMEDIPHYLIDILPPSTQFTAADFVNRALEAIKYIMKKKKLPIIAGGTGLYLKALINGLFPEEIKDPIIRLGLEQEARDNGLEKLREKLKEVDPYYAQKIGMNDRIRIIRALEVFYATGKPFSEHFPNTKSLLEDFNIIKIGLKLERNELYKKIENRVDKMFEKGIVTEVQNLLLSGVSEDSPPFRALGYKYVLQLLREEISLETAISLTKKDTRNYAKRQMTWFRKMEGIQWYFPNDLASIIEYVKNNLK